MAIICDFLIIGGGIAGASAAYYFADLGKVIVLEREKQPGYHSTGRSVALYRETERNPVITALARASHDFMDTPPDGQSLLSKRGMILTGREEDKALVDDVIALTGNKTQLEQIGFDKAQKLVPFLKPEFAHYNLYEPNAREIDVAALHQLYLKGTKQKGGQVVTGATVTDIQYNNTWHVTAGGEAYTAPTLINAAGAWADEIATLAGVTPVGLTPKRRTVITVEMPHAYHGQIYPMVIAADSSGYFKTEHGSVLVSPMDQTPVPPCDVQPEEIDIATAAWLLEERTTVPVKNIATRWAGLRTFTPSGSPMVAKAADNENFIWVVGQGGSGIKTADATARCAVSLYENDDLPEDVKALGLSVGDLH